MAKGRAIAMAVAVAVATAKDNVRTPKNL